MRLERHQYVSCTLADGSSSGDDRILINKTELFKILGDDADVIYVHFYERMDLTENGKIIEKGNCQNSYYYFLGGHFLTREEVRAYCEKEKQFSDENADRLQIIRGKNGKAYVFTKNARVEILA